MTAPVNHGWQDIATAPKDGTHALLFEPPRKRRYALNRTPIHAGHICVGMYRQHRMGGADCGYWLSVPGDWQRYPSHWQPLPEPPQ